MSHRAHWLAAASLLLLSGCGVGRTVSHELLGTDTAAATAPAQFGYAVADEPQAALIARQILNQGGNAADAAAAEGFALSVTLPSRAALGGGGACLVMMPGADGKLAAPVELNFTAPAPAVSAGDRPAAVPAMARGLLALQAVYGRLPAASVIVPAERLAGGGAQVSPALAADLAVVGPALAADPATAAVFAPHGAPLQPGQDFTQPDLAATLEVLRTQGVAGFYSGPFAARLAQAATQAGGGFTTADLAHALPHIQPAQTAAQGGYMVAALPQTASGVEALPASTGFIAVDKTGGTVACATSLNNLFGTGRIAPGTGILLAASPAHFPTPDLAAEIAYADGRFRAATTGTGQQEAYAAAADGMQAALTGQPAEAPEPGRTNLVSCPKGVPGGEASCTASADPRGQGLAIGGR
ncbi:gamma-glutamyltransferase [Acidocella sp.]|uniref:gamma-glutamyltransferase n=1 Tax=Acidocella sp. TaxID=50710 RepID=UPI00262E2AB7|nr:gamma-glutamyltransferase [Acidocella sp.]